ncbi:hypothetical protein [Paenarthrobacter sp. SD-2]|jgi:hypothetical protein|nr:hypothetical protein [Paenarthrobacter sp. SD-2]MDO5866978.1 hypothetical protein [Paenarthrobacter sp. SD-2]
MTHALRWVAFAGIVLFLAGCTQQPSVETADIPSWEATALPATATIVAEGSGKILDTQPVVTSQNVPEGSYTLTLACDGGGKAFLTARVGDGESVRLGAACFGARESTNFDVPVAGPLEITASSVDAPVLYAYHLTPRT